MGNMPRNIDILKEKCLSMKQTILIVHGASGSPQENWFPWLKHELEKKNFEVFVPTFPTPENQTLDHWMEIFEKYKEKLNQRSIVIGHSLGAAFLLNILEKQKIGGAFFVAPVGGTVDNEYWEGMRTFADKNFDWGAIGKNCRHFFVYHSDNDPYIPIDHAKVLSKNLGIQLTFVQGAGHFNQNSGYVSFPLLEKDILSLSKHL